MRKILFSAFMLCSASAAHAQVESAVEILRTDVRAQKVQILTQAMQLTSDEATAFWPLYREYSNALDAVWDQRMGLIKDYAAAYESMTDDVARSLMERAFAAQNAQTDVEREYFEKIAQVLPVTKAARFAQVEAQLNRMIATQIAAELPLVPDEAEKAGEGGGNP